MATYTPNYNLKKPAGTDFADVADLNANMDIIDEALEGKVDLDANGKVPAMQIPALSYIPASEKGAASGVASLDSGGKVPATQLPSMKYIPTSQKGAAGGVASLDTSGKVPAAQIPALDYIPTAQKGNASGVASLDSGGEVPAAQIPTSLIYSLIDAKVPIQAGTWTPILTNLNGQDCIYTSSWRNGRYYKIGKLVWVNMEWKGKISTLNGGDYAAVRGLPFSSIASASTAGIVRDASYACNDPLPSVYIPGDSAMLRMQTQNGSVSTTWKTSTSDQWLSVTAVYATQ